MRKFEYLLVCLLLLPFDQVTKCQTGGTVLVSLVNDVQFIVTDSIGHRTGWNPRTGAQYNEITNALYYQ
jgi:hypothetical protein